MSSRLIAAANWTRWVALLLLLLPLACLALAWFPEDDDIGQGGPRIASDSHALVALITDRFIVKPPVAVEYLPARKSPVVLAIGSGLLERYRGPPRV